MAPWYTIPATFEARHLARRRDAENGLEAVRCALALLETATDGATTRALLRAIHDELDRLAGSLTPPRLHS
ncbi:MAG: hypothetical protein OEO20_13990 [Gemmatimonadota bacterium]|nr:hypothetical protein [Gemmatimonadota bacterium]MDH3479403.1 hypothetical protein [Gemmatimonadota bacterium]MDH3571612.1 hypothetical protein [Gemmatimonadota bacterium]